MHICLADPHADSSTICCVLTHQEAFLHHCSVITGRRNTITGKHHGYAAMRWVAAWLRCDLPAV
jgi:hypothetical protein